MNRIANTPNKNIRILLYLFGGLVLLYSTIKAYILPLTWDEIYSFEYYVKKGIIILHTYNYIDANNHLLNTWLMELFYHLFGGKEIILRTPNLLAQLLFIVFSCKLSMRLPTRVLVVTTFLLLNLNPYVGDYFILARGYGISMGLMMMSFYYAYRFINENDSFKSAFISVLLSCIALLANFTMFNFTIILSFLLLAINFSRNARLWNNNKKNYSINPKTARVIFAINSIILVLPLGVYLLVIPIIQNLRDAEAIFAGADDGFWINTVVPLIKKSFNNTPIAVKGILFLELLIAAVCILSLLIIIRNIMKDKRLFEHSFFTFIFVLIACCSVANILQHSLFGIYLPYNRTAIIYIPMFTILLAFFIENCNYYFQKATSMICLFICVIMIGNFVHGMSLNRVIHHTWDHDLCDIIQYFKEHHKEIPSSKQNLTIGADKEFEEDLNNYRNIYYLTWLNKVEAENYLNPLNDYFYISKEKLRLLPYDSYIILKAFPKSGMLLLENKIQYNYREIFHQKIFFESEENPYYSYIIDDTLINNKKAIFNLKIMAYLEHLNQDATFIISFERNNRQYSKRIVPVNDFWTNQKIWTPVYLSVIMPDEIRKGDILKAFIVDNKKNPIKVQSMEVRIVAYY